MAKKVDEKIFKAVKAMTASGSSIADIAEVLHIAITTVSRIRKALDLDDYYDDMAKTARKQYERKKARRANNTPEPAPQKQAMNPTVVRVEATHYMMEEMRKTNELLTCISAKLAFIVDELCGTPTKKEG